MPDKFFAPAKSRKRKRPESRQNGRTKVPKKPKLDEELSEQSDEWGAIDEIDLRPEEPDPGASGDEEEDETPAEKRLRLAQLYLDSVKESLADGEFDAAEIDKELISSRLKQDVLEHSGKVHLFVADSYNLLSPPILRTRGHRFSVTSALASESGKYLFTSGKEGNIIKWDLSSGKKLTTIHKARTATTSTADSKSKAKTKARTSNMNSDVKGHTDEVLALALSSDGKYLASGGRDRRLIVWDAETTQWNKTFHGPMNHKDVISTLSFRKSTHQLFTASFDRTLKVYDLTPSVMGYVETLFGHQDSILALDSLRGDNCVSVGGRDKTARYWKIAEETQLVFRGGGRSRIREILEGGLGADDDTGHKGDGVKGKERESQNFVEGSLECIAMIDEATFVTGGDSGSISLWTTQKKKPIFTHPLAHGFNEVLSPTEGLIQTPRWITALATLRYSDLFISGSWEGQLRLWKLDNKLKSFALLGNIPIPGVINSLQITSPPKSFFISGNSWIPSVGSLPKSVAPALVVAGVGQEHRFGRWLSVKEAGALNGAFVVGLLPLISRTLS